MVKSSFLKCAFWVLMFVFCNQLSYGQELDWPKHQVKFSPVRLINLTSPGLELGYEYDEGMRSTSFSAAYLTDVFDVMIDATDYSGYRFSLEQKFFRPSYIDHKRTYFSCELSYGGSEFTVNKYAHFIPYEYRDESDRIQYLRRYDAVYHLDRKLAIANAKYGLQYRHKQFVFDASIGIGVFYQHIKYFNKEKPKDECTTSSDKFIFKDVAIYEPGHTVFFNLPLSFKVGYLF